MESLFDMRLTAILKKHLTPLLKPLGFRKRGNIYELCRGELSWIIDVQRSRWNDTEEAQFTLNCGVYVKGVLSTYLDLPEPNAPTLPYCCISVRMGMLNVEKVDKWWKLCEDDDVESIDGRMGSEIQERIQWDVLPFLRQFKSLQDVVSYLKGLSSRNENFVSPRDKVGQFAYIGILYFFLGQYDACVAALAQAEQEAIGGPIEEHIRQLRARVQGFVSDPLAEKLLLDCKWSNVG
ncbi:DUF4304 domain-containing protein [Candidatus Poribacteria bacterium]|nr:DUF4304 domain-containing protein [Candidatus Poribacteria bacterium]